MLLATAKPEVFARRIVDHFSLSQWLVGVHGSELDGQRSDKTELLAHIIEFHGLEPAHCLMVGDREHDAVAARNHGVACIGVLWGYGSRDELEAAGARRLIDQPSELPDACIT
jgi:phosphoglycolate phosphatase